MQSIRIKMKAFTGCIKMTSSLFKEVIRMNFVFTKESQMVKSAVFLFGAGIYKVIEDVPNIGNLREMVVAVMIGE